MTDFEYYQFPYGSDNYGVLVHDPKTELTLAIDAGDADAYKTALQEKGWRLSHILITHHHIDHTAGLAELKTLSPDQIYGMKGERKAHAHITHPCQDGEHINFAGKMIEVIATPGHTLDMLNFYIMDEQVCFTGDTLFTLGCGIVCEGDMAMMWHSLKKLIKRLPPDTVIYSAHEYSATNLRFAMSIDADNAELHARAKEIQATLAAGEASVPSLMAKELATNPFLRVHDPKIRAELDMKENSDVEVFAALRKRKNKFQ